MKKLLLATALAVVFSSAAYAQEADRDPASPDSQQTNGASPQAGDANVASDDPAEVAAKIPSDAGDDLLNGAGAGGSVLEDAAKEEAKAPAQDPPPDWPPPIMAPIPPGVSAHSYSQKFTESDGSCFWYVTTIITFPDGRTDWQHYKTTQRCDEPAPETAASELIEKLQADSRARARRRRRAARQHADP